MSDETNPRLSIGRATGISAGLHLFLVPFFVAVPIYVGAGHASDSASLWGSERVAVTSTLTLEHRQRSREVATRPAPQPERSMKGKTEAPKPGRAAGVARAQSLTPRAAVARTAAHPGLLALAPEPVQPEKPVPVPVRPIAAAIPSAPAATPSPVATQAGAATVALAAPTQSAGERGTDSTMGGWGQNFDRPILADESVLTDLRTKYHGSISVHVDETGRAIRVIVPASLSPEARDEIERRLTTLRYVPAECNGLRCAGDLTIAL
jgi:hypothetical protein